MKKYGLFGTLCALGAALGTAYLGKETYSIIRRIDLIWNHPDDFEKTVSRKHK